MPNEPQHPALLSAEALKKQCSVERTRASGPGGQHRNKVETAIVVTHQPSGVIGQANEKRSQHANLKLALSRLRVQLAIDIRSQPLADGPDALWTQRRNGRQIKVNPDHDDFAQLLVVALDVLNSHALDIAAAAQRLGVSTSQLVKFFKTNSNVWQYIQRVRQINGRPPLK